MAIGFRASSNSGSTSVSAATVAITLPAGSIGTDIVVVAFSYANSAKGSLGSWTPPAGWTQVAAALPAQANTTQDASIQLWWAPGDVATLTFTRVGTVNFLGWRAAAFTGVDTGTPIDAVGTGNSNTGVASLTANAVTVVTDQAWELIGTLDNNGGTTTATGFTVLSNYISRLLYNPTPKAVGSTGTVAVNSSSSSGQILMAQPFALRPAGAAGAVRNPYYYEHLAGHTGGRF